MHSQFEISQDGIEFGIRFEQRGKVDGAGGASPSPDRHRRAERKPPSPGHDDHANQTAEAKKAGPTVAQKVSEATKDGKISGKREATLFEHKSARAEARNEGKRLKEAVLKAAGGDDYQRDSKGELTLDKKDKAQKVLTKLDPTSHEKRLKTLEDNSDLDELDKLIKDVGDGPAATGLKAQRASRVEDEREVVKVARDKQRFIATLDVERRHLNADKPKDAEHDYQQLREKAAGAIAKLNANGGKFNDGGELGNDWDTEKVDFDRLAKRFKDEPGLLQEFARSQGNDDDDLGKTEEAAQKHLDDVIKDDAEKGGKISIRYKAAKELVPIFERYNELEDKSETSTGRLEKIGEEIRIAKESLVRDEKNLSGEVRTGYLAGMKDDNEVLDRTKVAKDSKDAAEEGDDAPKVALSPDARDNNEKARAEQAKEPKREEIDYGSSAIRTELLQAAVKHNYVPEGTTFDKHGQAVYRAQDGDSYWAIAQRAGGKAGFDQAVYANTIASNTAKGADPNQLAIGQRIEIANRGIDELVKTMHLPKTQVVDQE